MFCCKKKEKKKKQPFVVAAHTRGPRLLWQIIRTHEIFSLEQNNLITSQRSLILKGILRQMTKSSCLCIWEIEDKKEISHPICGPGGAGEAIWEACDSTDLSFIPIPPQAFLPAFSYIFSSVLPRFDPLPYPSFHSEATCAPRVMRIRFDKLCF